MSAIVYARNLVIKIRDSILLDVAGAIAPATVILFVLIWLICVIVPYYWFEIYSVPMSEFVDFSISYTGNYENTVGTYFAVPAAFVFLANATIVPSVVLLGFTGLEYLRRKRKWVKVALVCGLILSGYHVFRMAGLYEPRDFIWVGYSALDMHDLKAP